jgi:hypothetical protein
MPQGKGTYGSKVGRPKKGKGGSMMKYGKAKYGSAMTKSKKVKKTKMKKGK